MKWIDQPNWSDDTGRELHDALKTAFWRSDDLERIWIQIALDPATQTWNEPAAGLWWALMQDAHAAGKLEALIAEVQKRDPAIAPRLDAVLTAQVRAESWYACNDHFTARLVGRGNRRSLINRRRLVSGLKQLAHDDYVVFNIQGKPGSGKSHSRLLVQHVLKTPGLNSSLTMLDIAEEWPDKPGASDIDAYAFVRVLAQKVNMGTTFTVDLAHTQPERVSRDLANIFAARYASVPNPARWIFIDGLDRPRVLPDVHVLVSHLAFAAESGGLGETRLITTGHPGDFANSVLDVLVEEEIAEIDEDDLEGFFEEVGRQVGSPLANGEGRVLAAKVLAGASLHDLPALDRAASAEARLRFGP